ncbi:hypothetical protein FQN49_004579 [Arthroderma sp. PD_2]|nr:hypothetical protein FQN49_004579 [Arthroderma sp. PD_2]
MQTAFHQFGKLPTELQTMIWEEAYYLSTPQVIEGTGIVLFSGPETEYAGEESSRSEAVDPLELLDLDVRIYYVVFPSTTRQASTPAILSVCWRSRHVALRLGDFSTLWTNFPRSKKIRFDFSSDIVYLNELYADIHRKYWPHVRSPGCCTRIQHLATEWSLFHPSYCYDYKNEEDRWISIARNICTRFPSLTDLYFFVPAVRYKQSLHNAEIDCHFDEPDACEGLPIVLKPVDAVVSENEEVRLPECNCHEANFSASTTLEGTVANIEKAFNSDWLRKGVQAEIGQGAMANFPPRIHPMIFLRKGLKLEEIRNKDLAERERLGIPFDAVNPKIQGYVKLEIDEGLLRGT